MEVDFKKLNNFLDRYKEIIKKTEQAISLLETQVSKLAENSQTQTIISELKKNKNKLESVLLLSKKMKATLIKAMEIYTNCEEDLEKIIEGDTCEKIDFFRARSEFNENLFILLK